MKITVLSENTSACGLPSEHGLSLFIETGEHTILFDAGASSLFAENAAACGADLRRVDLAVLSHGHKDHSGGLTRFLELNDTAPVYMSRYAPEPHFTDKGEPIGVDGALLQSPRVILTDGVTELAPGLTLYSCNDRETPWGVDSAGLFTLRDGAMAPEDFRHEHYLLIGEGGRRILISGCSHKGVLNLMGWFRPDVLVGGFHYFMHPLDDTLRRYAEALDAFDTDYYTCHCTGVKQFDFMKNHMRRLTYISAGQTLTV